MRPTGRPTIHSTSPAGDDPRRLAAEFLERYRTAGHYLRANIDELAVLATTGDERQISEATGAIFGALVEPLSDSFDPGSVGLYIRLMAQIIQYCRRLDAGLDLELTSFGVLSEQDLIDGAERLRPVTPASAAGASPSSRPDTIKPHRGDSSASEAAPASPADYWITPPHRIKRVIVLSRVTIGADVAVTSVIVERLKQKFPQAALTLVGGAKIRETFGADRTLDFAELEYGRRATLIGRLGAWVDLVHGIRDLTAGLTSDEFLVVDPDSRLTQLGMLPVADPSNYLFFPSREYLSTSAEPLPRLASHWSGQILSLDEIQLPRVAIGPADIELGRNVVQSLRNLQTRAIVSVNFGVGDNDKKRVGQDFEAAIIDFLLDHRACVILDRGAGSRESSHTDALIARLAAKRSLESPESPGSLESPGSPESSESLEGSEGPESSGSSGREFTFLQADEQKLRALCQGGPMHADMLTFNGRVGLLAALIAASDLYIGYDSAGQHIAAAAGTPCIDVFAGYSYQRMIDRWRPTGPGKVTVVDAGHGRTVAQITEEVKAAASDALRVSRQVKS